MRMLEKMTQNIIRITGLVILMVLMTGYSINVSGKQPISRNQLKNPWQKHPELFDTPAITWVDSIGPDYSLYYEGASYQGKKTKVFAYYSVPETFAEKIPAMVLAHGGGGKAFQNWAKQWAGYGYAAIAMNLYGEDNEGNQIGYLRHVDTDDDFDVKKSEIFDSWHYQAPAALIRAISFLESRNEVDKDNIGIMGISWGGYNTSTVVGIDDRLSAAIIIYGCGELYQNSIWKREKYKFSSAYKNILDPSNYLPQADLPILWANNNTDHFFPLDSFQKSRKLTASKGYIRIQDNYQHGYETPWNTEDIHRFADAFLKHGDSWPEIVTSGFDKEKIWAEVDNICPTESAWLVYTTNPNWMYCSSRNEGDDVWVTIKATINKEMIYAEIPDNAVAAYLYAIDKMDREFSTDYYTIPKSNKN